MYDLLINRRELTSFEVRQSVKPTIATGQAVLALDRFGMTSNNLTYALTGKVMGYWRYFSADPGWGRMPVWGFAEVERWGFEDTGGDPLHSADSEDQLTLLRILFLTAFLLADFIDRARDCAPVDTIILSSASSKTALAAAHELRERHSVRVVGLTSARNTEFVRGTSAFDQVVEYEGISELGPSDSVYGASGIANAYQAVVGGKLDPSAGFVITPTGAPGKR